jgi:hypothetical protein
MSAANSYHFVTNWVFRDAHINEVVQVLSDARDLPRWWPQVYLAVTELAPGDANGVGKHVELHTKGWLPYTLRWRFVVTESNPPHGFAIRASGDFEGEGRWSLRQDGATAHVTYDWRIRAEKPLLRRLSFLLKPFFSANHEWAMARGYESLERELLRRRAAVTR